MSLSLITVPAHVGDSSFNPPSETRRFRLFGTVTSSTVMSTALAGTPAIVLHTAGTLYRQDLKITQFAYDMWDIEVPYGPRPNANGEWTWDFDTTGGEVHITNSKETVRSYVHPDAAVLETDAPNYHGSIDVQGEQNDVKGIDIVIPTMRLNVQYRHPQGTVTMSFARQMMDITGLVNSHPFLGWAAGEVLFLGAQGSDGTNTDASVNYAFAISRNTASLSIDTYPAITKEGWNPIWIRYEDETVTDGGGVYIKPSKLPRYIYIERVYDTVNLAAALGFGA